MSPVFVKYHLDEPSLLHHFTAPEPHADPHDHPWGFHTTILVGGYVEEVFDPVTWTSHTVFRAPGTSHSVLATHVHRIIELPLGECLTLVTPGPWERVSGFWRDGVWRAWDA